MVFDPFVAWGESDTKLTIIHILNTYGTLPAKKIFNHLKKDFGVSVTYQATHKALKKMHESKILDFVNSEYKINPEWVKRMRAFCEELEKNPKAMSEVFSLLEKGQTVNFTARTEMEEWEFVVDFTEYYLKSGGSKPVIMNTPYVWSLLPSSDSAFKIVKNAAKKVGLYIVSEEGLDYDQIMSRHWTEIGAKVVIGIEGCISNCDVLVFGDYVINMYRDSESLKRGIEDNKTIHDESEINYNNLYEIVTCPVQINFVIIKNKDVAEKIREKSLTYFK